MQLNVRLADFFEGNEENISSHTLSFLFQFSKNYLGFNSDSFLLLLFNAELKTFSWKKK